MRVDRGVGLSGSDLVNETRKARDFIPGASYDPPMTLKTFTDYATYAWMAAFLVFFVLSIVVGIIQHIRKRELWDTPALAVLMLLWIVAASGLLAYAIAGRFGSVIVIPVFLIFGAVLLRGLWDRISGKSK